MSFESTITLLTSNGRYFFQPEEIIRLEASSNYTTIFFSNKTKIAPLSAIKNPGEWTGTLKKMEFINPHSMLHLDVTAPDGKVTEWVFQTTAVAALRSRGLARSGPGSLEVGAKYTVKGFSARNGNPMGFMKTLVFPDGKEVVFWFGDPNGN